MTKITIKGKKGLIKPSSLGNELVSVGTLRHSIRKLSSYKEKIYTILKQNIEENLSDGRAGSNPPNWPKLKKYTYIIRAIKGFPISGKYPVLHRTGRLERGFGKRGLSIETTEDRMSIRFTNLVPYAAIQNEGGTEEAELVTLKKQYGHKHYKVLVNPGEKVDVARKFRAGRGGKILAGSETSSRKRVTVKVPARPFAYFNEGAIKKLKNLIFTKIIGDFWNE